MFVVHVIKIIYIYIVDISELDICMHHVCDCDVLRHVYVIPVLEEAS